jgi:lipopolysaccharide/colanic/teichoic acid biosynthesis glycosyltransferase
MYLDVEARSSQIENGLLIILSKPQCLKVSSYMNASLKRAIDIVVSLVALIVLSPILLFIAFLIRIESRGPALFSQQRWGRGCSTIKVYKFRSMYVDMCDPTGVAQTVENDPRITRVGRWLRRTNIDELPQLINVFLGDMSLVGPRCHAIGMRAAGVLYEELVPEYHLRHSVRPGMTGLAQVRGWRGSTESASAAKARISADLYYIERASWFLDVEIIVATVVKELRSASGS